MKFVASINIQFVYYIVFITGEKKVHTKKEHINKVIIQINYCLYISLKLNFNF